MVISNLSVLSIGNVYKNYPDLCSALDESVKTSNSKKAQLAEWSRFFEWERIGHSYKITKIHNPPKPKEEGRKKPSKYANAAYLILINEMYQRYKRFKYTTFYTSKTKLIQLFGFYINFDYEYFCKTNFEKRLYYKFQNDCKTEQYNIVNRILENLVKLKKINCVERFNITKGSCERKANKNEEKIIREAKANILKDMDCESVYFVRLQGLEKQFMEKINEYLSGYGFMYDKTFLEITLCDDNGMQKQIDDVYNECFADIPNFLIDLNINKQKQVLSDLCKQRIKTMNNREIDKYKYFIYLPDDSDKEYNFVLLDELANVCVEARKTFFKNMKIV